MRKIAVSSPATIANLGPCFDVLGVALETPRDIVEVELVRDSNKITIDEISGINSENITKDVNKNTAGLAAKALINKLGLNIGLKIRIKKGIRAASGMGSSGASAAGVVFAISKLLDVSVADDVLIEAAAEGERAAANAPHADNVAAAIVGGFVVLRSHHPIDYICFSAPKDLRFSMVLPEFKLETAKSRAVLPKVLPLKDSVRQMSGCAYLIAALMKGDIAKIGAAVNSDILVEPLRARLIKGFKKIKKAALESGAYGCSISGGGPSIFAVCDTSNQGKVLAAMEETLIDLKIRFTSYATKPSNRGVKIIE
ncbi:MAG: homoserine kinase [Candidatus Odinarchaeia archaeon]